MNTPLELHLPQFQGPLDLLLHLIQKNEMDIHEIRIAEITDQYLSYLNLMQMLDLDVASEYLVMASTLLYIKSQSMLPTAKSAKRGIHDDAREDLVRQLLEYKRIKEASRFLVQCQEAREQVYPRTPEPEYVETATSEYHIRATLFDLLAAFQNALRQQEEFVPDFPTEISEEPVTVEQKIHEVLLELQLNETMEFGQFFKGFQTKLELICIFLAILELTRMKQIFAFQPEPFGVILIRLNPERPDIGTFQLTTDYGSAITETNY